MTRTMASAVQYQMNGRRFWNWSNGLWCIWLPHAAEANYHDAVSSRRAISRAIKVRSRSTIRVGTDDCLQMPNLNCLSKYTLELSSIRHSNFGCFKTKQRRWLLSAKSVFVQNVHPNKSNLAQRAELSNGVRMAAIAFGHQKHIST